MHTECAYTRKLLPRFLTGHLFALQRKRIERHLAACRICSSEHDALRRIHETRAILRDIDGSAGAGAAMRRWTGTVTRLLYRPVWLAFILASIFALSVYVVRPMLHDPDLERLDASAPLPAAAAPPVAVPVPVAVPTPTAAPAVPAAAAPAVPAAESLVVTITVDRENERAGIRQINEAMKEHPLLRTMRFSDTVREISGSLTAHELYTFFNRISTSGKIAYRQSRLAKAETGELIPFVLRLRTAAAPPAPAGSPVDKPADKSGEKPVDKPVDKSGEQAGGAGDRPADRSAPTTSPVH